MCGLIGALTRTGIDEERVRHALTQLRHRGPDASGIFRATIADGALLLGQTRLSIIDLKTRSDQPFLKHGLSLIYNGEIYNYREVRSLLEARGHTFTTASDTEVVIEAYRCWGRNAVDHFEGMWALALFDPAENIVWLSRDRFGEKPLYLWHRPEGLYFGSEIKALATLAGQWPEVNRCQLRRYIVNGYKSLYKRPRTWFRDIEELPPATNAIATWPFSFKTDQYWSLRYTPTEMSLDEAIEGTRSRLLRAVELRLRSDVPIAFCLSGGVDSSTLAGIAARGFGQKLQAFSILDEDERYNETDNILANVESLGCEWHPINTTRTGFIERLAKQIRQHDAPIVTITYYLHQFLLEAIAAGGFKVSISGTAADELFTGYYDHYGYWLAEQSARHNFKQLVSDWHAGYGAFVQNPLLKDPEGFIKNPGARGHIYLEASQFNTLLVDPMTEEFEEEQLSDSLLRSRMLNELRHETVPVILKEDDLNAMSVSVENRSPYLDRELAEYLFSVPSEHLIYNGYPKYLLRAAGKGFVPDQVRFDRRKRGFNANISSLIDVKDPASRDALLSDSPIFEIIRRPMLEEFIDKDLHANSCSKALFSIISAKTFLDIQAERSRSISQQEAVA